MFSGINFSFSQALFYMEWITAFSLVLQSIEFLQTRSYFSDRGVWEWSVVREEFAHLPNLFRNFLDVLLSQRGFTFLVGLRPFLAIAAALTHSGLLWTLLWLSTLLISMRWRGTFNGGSDYMTLIVLFALSVARSSDDLDPRWISVALGYVALQTALSFFIAGVAKLKSPNWRSGKALSGFLASEYYGSSPTRVRNLSPRLMKLGSWVIIVYECAFPLSVFDPALCLGVIITGFLFQVSNAWVFGLNRFVWAWAGAYPALYWFSFAIQNGLSSSR